MSMKTISSLMSYCSGNYFSSWFTLASHNCCYFVNSPASGTDGLQHRSSRCSLQFLFVLPRDP